MNYRHAYMCIVMHAKQEMLEGKRPLTKYQRRKNFPNQYFEFHHILPKSIFPLWTKRKSNIVALTAREHFFCHQLLIKIYQDSCIALALYWLYNGTQKQYYKISSREYLKIKQSIAVALKHKYKGKSHNKGLYATFSEKKKQEIKEKRKNTKIKNGVSLVKENNPMYGKHWKDHPEWKHYDRNGKNNPNYGNHKLAGKNNPMYGKKVKSLTKRVKCIEDNIIFESCRDCEKYYNIHNVCFNIKNGKNYFKKINKHFMLLED